MLLLYSLNAATACVEDDWLLVDLEVDATITTIGYENLSANPYSRSTLVTSFDQVRNVANFLAEFFTAAAQHVVGTAAEQVNPLNPLSLTDSVTALVRPGVESVNNTIISALSDIADNRSQYLCSSRQFVDQEQLALNLEAILKHLRNLGADFMKDAAYGADFCLSVYNGDKNIDGSSKFAIDYRENTLSRFQNPLFNPSFDNSIPGSDYQEPYYQATHGIFFEQHAKVSDMAIRLSLALMQYTQDNHDEAISSDDEEGDASENEGGYTSGTSTYWDDSEDEYNTSDAENW